MRKGALASVVTTAAVLLGGAVGSAEAAAPKSAQRFADAVLRVKERIVAAGPAMSEGFRGFDACAKWADASEGDPERSEAIERKAALLVQAAVMGPALDPTRPAFDLLIADLDAIPTRDPVLRAGREAWREEVAAIRALPTVQRPCERLRAWHATGYAAASTPAVPFDAYDAFFTPNAQVRRNLRRLEAAAHRLQQLGIRRGAARRFTGDDLYEPVWEGDEFGGVMPPRTRYVQPGE